MTPSDLTLYESRGQFFTLKELVLMPFYPEIRSILPSFLSNTPVDPIVRSDFLTKSPELLAKVSEELAEKGMRSFSYLASGVMALVLDTTEDQLVRLSPSYESVRPTIPQMLMPMQTEYLHDSAKSQITVEYLPRVQQKGVKEIHMKALAHAALHLGYIDSSIANSLNRDMSRLDNFQHYDQDTAPKNIFLLKDGTPLFLDGGALTPIAAVDKLKALPRNFIEDALDLKGFKQPFTWVTPDGTWKQHHEFPQIQEGKLHGMVTGMHLEGLAQERSKSGQERTWEEKAIGELGLYPEQVGDLMKRAHREWTNAKKRRDPEAGDSPDSYLMKLLEARAREQNPRAK